MSRSVHKFLKSVKKEYKKLKKSRALSLQNMSFAVLCDSVEFLGDFSEEVQKEKRKFYFRNWTLPRVVFASAPGDLLGINPFSSYYKTKAFKDNELERLLRLRIMSRYGTTWDSIKSFEEEKHATRSKKR